MATTSFGQNSLLTIVSTNSLTRISSFPLSSKSKVHMYSLMYSPASVSALALNHMQMRRDSRSSRISLIMREKFWKIGFRFCNSDKYLTLSWGFKPSVNGTICRVQVELLNDMILSMSMALKATTIASAVCLCGDRSMLLKRSGVTPRWKKMAVTVQRLQLRSDKAASSFVRLGKTSCSCKWRKRDYAVWLPK